MAFSPPRGAAAHSGATSGPFRPSRTCWPHRIGRRVERAGKCSCARARPLRHGWPSLLDPLPLIIGARGFQHGRLCQRSARNALRLRDHKHLDPEPVFASGRPARCVSRRLCGLPCGVSAPRRSPRPVLRVRASMHTGHRRDRSASGLRGWPLLNGAEIGNDCVDLSGFEFKARHVAVADSVPFRERFFERINRIISRERSERGRHRVRTPAVGAYGVAAGAMGLGKLETLKRCGRKRSAWLRLGRTGACAERQEAEERRDHSAAEPGHVSFPSRRRSWR